MKPKENQKEIWLNYIRLLIDRKLSKKQASGINTWVLLGLFGWLSYKIIENFQILFQNNNFSRIILLIINFCNLILSFFLILIPFILTSFNSEERNILSRFDKKRREILITFFALFMLPIGIINLIIGYNLGSNGIISWTHYLFGISFLIQGGGMVLLRSLLKKITRGIDFPELNQAFMPSKKKQRTNILVLYVFWGLTLLILNYFPLNRIILNYPIVENIEIIKLSLNVIVFSFVLNIFLFKIITQSIEEKLEDLERRIILEEIKPEEIKEKFLEEYYGRSIKDYIKNLETEINNRLENIEWIIDRITMNYNSLNKKEEEKRFNKIENQIELIKFEIDEFNDSINNNIKRFKVLFIQNLNEEEEHGINKLLKKCEDEKKRLYKKINEIRI